MKCEFCNLEAIAHDDISNGENYHHNKRIYFCRKCYNEYRELVNVADSYIFQLMYENEDVKCQSV